MYASHYSRNANDLQIRAKREVKSLSERRGKRINNWYISMPYIKRTVIAGETVEILKYYSGRYGRHTPKGDPLPRSDEEKETAERANLRRQERELRWTLNANFKDGRDALVTLSWKKGQDQPEDSKTMRRETGNFIRKIRRAYRKAGKELRYCYTMEIGPKGSRHIHMVLSNADLSEIQRCWPGIVDVRPLYSNGNYADIASYFVKYSLKTEKTEGQKLGRRYSCSHNMIKPKIRIEVVNASTFRETPGHRKGYLLDESRTRSGISELTGKRYLECTYIRDRSQARIKS